MSSYGRLPKAGDKTSSGGWVDSVVPCFGVCVIIILSAMLIYDLLST
jgi:hypothetical protein